MQTDIQLRPKQQRFVDAYLGEAKGNGIEAARIAGYAGSYSVLGVTAHDNLKKPKIMQALSQRTKQSVVKAEKRIINTYEEFTKNLEFVGKLRDACNEWLTDPEHGDKFTINPRGDEIDVVYFDYEDKDAQGNAKRKTASLQEILARLNGTRYAPATQYVKTVDLREYALKTIDRIDTTLDKFAKMGGDYTKDKANPADVTALARTLAQRMFDSKTRKVLVWGDEMTAEECYEFAAGQYNLPPDQLGRIG